ncbi:B12-binding domain-containing radical SAM protein [Lacrimispora aerotolerans]|uniref:B12-binding domain-containing radical SAM protein n=1 Tax=Lacrimispora aerotolerans TaxID=36832 RepID=UPI00047C5443|nr:radical SAM protein [Lacrimispora aerotolerans]
MFRLALINPPYLDEESFEKSLAPMGICYIAAYLENMNIACDVYDFSSSDLSNDELIEKYQLVSYNLIAFSTYTCSFKDTVALAEAIKNHNSKVIIIMGGHHVTLAPSEVLRDFPVVDFVTVGYGEQLMFDLVSALNKGYSYKDIPGIGYKDGENIVVNDTVINDINLDLIPFPKREIVTDYGYNTANLIEGKKIINIVTSRGCVYNCHFCVNTKNNHWLPRSVNNVIDEMKNLYDGNQFNHIFFTDCNFLIDPYRAMEIVEKVYEFNKNITMNFHARCDQIVKYEKIIRKMGAAGCAFINVGVESNSEAVLKRFNKRISPETNQHAIEILKDAGIHPNVYMIMFEALVTIDDIYESYIFLKKNKLTNFVGVHNLYNSLMPFYGTPYWNNYGEFYTQTIHGISKTYFQNKDVKKFYYVIKLLREEYEKEISSQVAVFMKLQVTHPKLIDKNLYQNYILVQNFQYIAFEKLLEYYKNQKELISYVELKANPLISDYINVIEENRVLLKEIESYYSFN